MTEAIVVAGTQPLSQRGMLTRELLKAEAEQRQFLGDYVKQQMVEGTDYGKIPGTDKPTLLKPGAQKLIAIFRCEPRFDLVRDMCREDFETGFFKYTFKCAIVGPNGATIAEGYGSANSREARYRWRNANRKCPSCGKEAVIKGKAEFGGGWLCFKKKDGCGAKFKDGDPTIESQPQGRVENEDIADLDNTILKMAKKRAEVDGAITLARCSDMFTQDVEDFQHGQESRPPPQEDGPPPADGDGFAPSDAEQRWATRDDMPRPKDAALNFVPFKDRRLSSLSLEELGQAWDAAMVLCEQDVARMRKEKTEGLEAKPAPWVAGIKKQLALIEQWKPIAERRAEAATKAKEASP